MTFLAENQPNPLVDKEVRVKQFITVCVVHVLGRVGQLQDYISIQYMSHSDQKDTKYRGESLVIIKSVY